MAEKAITWYNRLKEAINGQIKENGKREITGAKLNSVLNQMVDALGKNMTFGGVVSPATVIDNTDDNPVFYLALEAGNYPYCGNIVVGQGQIAFLFRDANNIWHQASWNASDENFTTEEKEKLQGLPTQEELRDALGAKANAPESKPGSDNLASFDENGNLKDSGVSIPVPTEEEKEHVLSSGETGLEWVPKPADGDDAYGVYVNEYKDGHGGSTDGMLTRPQWLLSLKGEKGDDAVNPFKGWFDSSDDIPTQGAKKGDYAYVTTNGISKIWRHNGTAFVNTNETVSQEQTFNSNEKLSAVKIDDTHLDNPVGDDEIKAPTLAKAEDVMQLKAKLTGVTAIETKGYTSIDYNGYIVCKTTTNSVAKTYKYDGVVHTVFIPIPQNAKKIRFLGRFVNANTFTTGYAFINAESQQDIQDNIIVSSGSSAIDITKYIVELHPWENNGSDANTEINDVVIPDGATYFCAVYGTGRITQSNFYCYLQTGDPALNHNDIANDFLGGTDKVLSAEKGKELNDRFVTVVSTEPDEIFYPETGGIYTYLQSKQPGDTLEEVKQTFSSDFQLWRYDILPIDQLFYSTVKPNIPLNHGSVWIFYWANENKQMISREKQYGNGLTNQTVNTWENYQLVPPQGAKYLYVEVSNKYSNRYSMKKSVISSLQDVSIEFDETHLTNSQSDDAAKATDVMELRSKLQGVTLEETKVVVDDNIIYPGYVLCKSTLNPTSVPKIYPANATIESTNYRHVVIDVEGYKSVRFLGKLTKTRLGAGWAFYDETNYQDDQFLTDNTGAVEYGTYDYDDSVVDSVTETKEHVVNVPEGAKYLKLCYNMSQVTPLNFYCYLQTGNSVGNLLDDLVTVKRVIMPVKRIYKYINRNEVEENVTNIETYLAGKNYNRQSSALLYKIDSQNKYWGSGRLSVSSSGTVYYWADENYILLRKDKPISGVDASVSWENERLYPPTNARYLYVWATTSVTTNKINDISYYNIVEEKQVSLKEYVDSEQNAKKLNVLVIGNSTSEDMFSYVPIIMRNIAPNVRLTMNILMQSLDETSGRGKSKAHYNNFINDTKAYYWSYWTPDFLAWRQGTGGSSDTSAGTSIKDILNSQHVDIIILNMALSSDQFKYTNALFKKITDYVTYNVQFALYCPPSLTLRGITDGGYDFEITTNNALFNINYYKRFAKTSPVQFIVPACAAIQNARYVPGLQDAGSFIENSSNTSGKGWLGAKDGVHFSDGIARQIESYVAVGCLLECLGMSYDGIMGDNTDFVGPSESYPGLPLRWWNCPHPHPNTSEDVPPKINGTNPTNVRLGQICAMMALKHPTSVYDMSQLTADVETEGVTMEFKRIFRINYNIKNGVTLSSFATKIINEGESYSTTISVDSDVTINSITILLGELDITNIAYNSDNNSIRIGNVSDTITIKIE